MAAFQSLQNRRGVPLAGLLLVPLLLAIVTFVVRGSLLLHTSESVVYVPRGRSRLPRRKGVELSAESWAGFAPPDVAAGAGEVESLLSKEERQQLRQLCGRCLYYQLNVSVSYGNSHKVRGRAGACRPLRCCCRCHHSVPLPLLLQVFVATGDIPYMWIRDSAVQLGPLVARMSHRPALRLLVEGAVRTQVRPWDAAQSCHASMNGCQQAQSELGSLCTAASSAATCIRAAAPALNRTPAPRPALLCRRRRCTVLCCAVPPAGLYDSARPLCQFLLHEVAAPPGAGQE